MKPRKFFQPLLFLALMVVAGGFSQRANAQYQSFFGDSITEYSIGTYATMYDPTFFGRESHSLTYYSNDTVVFNGKAYLRPHCDSEANPDYYIREDTLLGRIYKYCTRTNAEYLICDMSLEVGDTFAFPFHPNYYVENDYYHANHGEDYYIPIGGIVDTIVYLNGKKNIIFRTDTASNNPCSSDIPLLLFFDDAADDRIPIQFIEGIGSNYSPCGTIDDYFLSCAGGFFYNYMGSWTWEFSYPLLLCVHKDGEITYMADERAGCDQMIPFSVKDTDLCNWTVYPNPVHSTLNIRFKTELVRQGTIYITDMLGRVVCSQEVQGQHLKINVKHLQPGFYVATCFVEGKKLSVKFVKK